MEFLILEEVRLGEGAVLSSLLAMLFIRISYYKAVFDYSLRFSGVSKYYLPIFGNYGVKGDELGRSF
jgi:hypothetical protein